MELQISNANAGNFDHHVFPRATDYQPAMLQLTAGKKGTDYNCWVQLLRVEHLKGNSSSHGLNVEGLWETRHGDGRLIVVLDAEDW